MYAYRVAKIATAAAAAVALALPVGQAGAHGAHAPAVVAHADTVAIDRGTEVRAVAAPALWCGERLSSDDTAHERDNGSHRYHAIYAVPSDGTDRFDAVAHTLQADALQASALLERQYGRAIRFDMGTKCGPDFLDISIVRLPHSRDQLAAFAQSGSVAILTQIGADLAEAGYDPLPMTGSLGPEAAARAKNYLVWLDDVDVTPLCGVGTTVTDTRRDAANVNNFGGKLALVFRDGDRFCNSNTVRHEIGHNLGALMSQAPNAIDGAHCGDAFEDTMCLPSAPRRDSGEYQSQYFDYGNDDYWDPPGKALGWWTVNLNRFLCSDAACNRPPAGTVAGALTDALNDAGKQLLGKCTGLGMVIAGGPCTSALRKAGVPAHSQAPPTRPKLRFRARRKSRARWQVTLELRNGERASVTVTCRRGAKRVRALRRRLNAGTPVRAAVRCDGGLRATATAVASPTAA